MNVPSPSPAGFGAADAGHRVRNRGYRRPTLGLGLPATALHLPGVALRLPAMALLFLLHLGISGCEHPIGIVTPHIEAADLILRAPDGTEIARTAFNREWSLTSLTLEDDVPLVFSIVPLDFRGQEIDVTDRPDITFRMEARDPALLQWEPLGPINRILPFGAGETEVRFLIWHVSHADFVTPWIRVRVHPASSPFEP